MITGVWISPDRTSVAIQFDDDVIVVEDEVRSYAVDVMPAAWQAIFGAGV